MLVGVCLTVVVEILGLPVLPFAIGVYLPVQLNACIMIGGLIRLFFDKMKRKDKEEVVTDGILYCSGMIAGEGLVGIILAIFAVAGMDGVLNLSGVVALPSPIPELLSLLVFALMILCLLKFTIWKKRNK